MDSLYLTGGRYTPKANEIDSKTSFLIKVYFRSLMIEGYSPREVSHIMHQVINDYELEAVLGDQIVESDSQKRIGENHG